MSLIEKVIKGTLFILIINIQFHYYYCYSDSTIAIHSESENIKKFGGPANPLREARSIFGESVTTSRFKRNTNVESQTNVTKIHGTGLSGYEPETTTFYLNNSHLQVMVDWAGEGSKVVVCVTKDIIQNVNSTTNIYISYDYGTTFQDKTDKFKVGNKPGIIYKYYKNEKFTERFVFVDTINKFLFVTNDYGHTIIGRKLDFTPSEVSTHPTNSLIFVVMDREDEMKKLWISVDFGETWKTLSLYVKSYYWSEKSISPTLYVEREKPGNENSVLAFDSFTGEEFSQRLVIDGVKDFKIEGDFLFAVKKKPKLLGETNHEDTLQLWISYKEGPFLLSEFPESQSHRHYYVADVSDGQIMVCVSHGISSNLYVSSIPRSSEDNVKFSLSLENILHFFPGNTWNNKWLRKKGQEEFVDLHRVKGIRGVLIASQLFANFTEMPVRLGPEYLTSVITFDQGGEWSLLRPPMMDSDGQRTHCLVEKGCSLHISQELSKLYPETQSKPILTTKSAPGLIISTGTLGKSLKGHPGVFLSTDAGVTWYEVLKGNYLYTFGDHGGIIVAVQHYRFNSESNEILYSIDEGETWRSHQFFDEKIRVYGLMTEPGENTTIFTIFGSKSAKHEWVIVKVDMTKVFTRKCDKSDYKTWIPFDASSGRKCLLGRRDVYERRAPQANCYNGINYDRPFKSEKCPCTRDDYECDFGYVASVQQLSSSPADCIKESEDMFNPILVPLPCKDGKFYNLTKGYRKVPGDSCMGGEEKKYEPDLTACPVEEEKEFLLVSNRKNILRYDLINPDEGLQTLPLQNLEAVIALDFHLKNNCLYWSDATLKKIMRQCFDGHHRQETLVDKDIENVEGLALDWVSHSLYFVDGSRKTLEVTNIEPPLAGRIRKTLITAPDLDQPRGIALHPVKGYLFLTDWSDTKPMVGRAHLDGSNLEILFAAGQVNWPNGITVDFQTERIFWADAKLDYIASSKLDGSDFVKVIESNENLIQPFAVGVYKSMLFWDDWNRRQIFQADKTHGRNIVPLSKIPLDGLVDLKVLGHFTQTGSNACGERAGNKCQFFCMGTPDNGHTCLCPSWLKTVQEDGYNKCVCEDGSEPTAIGACKESQNTCSSNLFSCDNGICIPHTMLCDLDNDCGDLSDEKNCGVSSCESNSWQCKNGHCISPSWRCDTDNDCGDNSDEEDCEYPTCNADQFTCNNKRCINKIWRCDLQNDCRDGSDEANCTYPHPHQGSCNSAQFLCKPSSRCIPISWTCDNEVDCSDGSDEANCENHTCSHLQFRCPSNRCIYASWVCDGDEDCQDGADERNCTSTTPAPMPPTTTQSLFPKPGNHTCSYFEFRCTNGNCIPFWWRCDNAFDCLDGSDEVDCKSNTDHNEKTTTKKPPTVFACKEDQMECFSGECIWEAWVCDGAEDCSSGEDETNCHLKPTCTEDQFRCWHSEGCIEAKARCNGHMDCPDGSDELGCDFTPTNSSVIPNPCLEGFFSCDGGLCLPQRKICDHIIDCYDESDEKSCTDDKDKVYQVFNLKLLKATNTSLSFLWDFNRTGSGENETFEFLPSYILYNKGDPNAWKNGTWTTNKNYTLNNLKPYTTYRVKVFVRAKGKDMVYIPAERTQMNTTEGIPSPPLDVKVSQMGQRLLIEWKPPYEPNGPIVAYRVYISPPEPPKLIEVERGLNKLFFLPPYFDQNFTIYMTCLNSKYPSGESDRVQFSPSNVDQAVRELSVKSKNVTDVILTWKPISGVDGYIVSYNQNSNETLPIIFKENVTKPEIQLKNLSPGLKYNFKVRGFKGSAIGPSSSLEVTTVGDRLPSLQVQQKLLKDPGTAVRISWHEPLYKSKYFWTYEIRWGKTNAELLQSVHTARTTNTSYVVRNLDACEAYTMAVMIAGPIGMGPAFRFQIRTMEDSLSPPKQLAVVREYDMMKITWLPPCPQSFSTDNLRYMLKVTEISFKRLYYIDLPTNSGNITQTYKLKMHYGGKYKISVRTHLNNSREGPPVFIDGPQIPPPELHGEEDTFYWRNNKTIPNELLQQNYSYVLYLRRLKKNHCSNDDSEPAFELEVKESPYQVLEIEPGQIYCAAVAFKDEDGYMSPKSQFIKVEKPVGDALVVRKSSVVGVAISVIIVIILLVAVVIVLMVRHKRLARSFSAFANSHYDRSQGTTHITTDHNLDEDDSPMIRGFSDDEPLVIA